MHIIGYLHCQKSPKKWPTICFHARNDRPSSKVSSLDGLMGNGVGNTNGDISLEVIGKGGNGITAVGISRWCFFVILDTFVCRMPIDFMGVFVTYVFISRRRNVGGRGVVR